MNEPFLLPRSSTVTVAPATERDACLRETVGSSILTGAGVSLPTTFSPSVSRISRFSTKRECRRDGLPPLVPSARAVSPENAYPNP